MNIKNLCIIAILIITSIITIGITPKEETINYTTQTIRIHQGDTFWGLSKKYCPQSEDNREWIYSVKKLNNNCSSNLQVGENLKILVEKK